MPSDSIEVLRAVDEALHALAPRIDTFRSAVAAADEEVRQYVSRRRGDTEFKGEKALIELGPFALGRIDPERFAALIAQHEELSSDVAQVLDRADAILTGFTGSDDFLTTRVPPGGDLRDSVKDALKYVGQVFGASRAVELARAGTYDPDVHNRLLGPLAFRFWNRAERALAPPLVVEMSGDDCLPAGLGEYLDGTVTLVLVATGPTTAAPLARLITPGTFVMQTTQASDLERLAASPHPGIALLLDESRPEQALFVHDPDAGETPWDRIEVSHMPEHGDVGRGRRAPTWLEEVEHLRMLSTRPEPVQPPADTPSATGLPAGQVATDAVAPATDADQLAAWLLSQTDLS